MANNFEGAESLGAYPVFNTSSSVNLYGKILANKQAQQAAEQKAVADKLAKLNTKGLREQDKNKYYSGFEKWRDLSQQADRERDSRKRFDLQNEAEKQYQDLLNLPARSAQKAQRDFEIGKMVITKPHLLPKEQRERWQKSLDAELDSENDIGDYNQILTGHDFSKIPDLLNKEDDQLLQTTSTQTNPTERRVRMGNQVGTEIRRQEVVDPNKQFERYSKRYETDDIFKAYLEQAMPELPWDDNPQVAKDQALKTLVSQRRIARDVKPEYKWDFKESKGDGSGSSTIVDQPQDLLLYFGSPSDNANGTQPVATGKGVVKLPLRNMNLQGSKGINLSNGQPSTIARASNDGEIVSVGNYYIAKKDLKITDKSGKTRVIKAGGLVQDKYAEQNPNAVELKPMLNVQIKSEVSGLPPEKHLIDYKYLPRTLTKQQQAILGTFKPATQQQSSQPKQNNQASKMVTFIMPNGQTGQIPADKAADFQKKYPTAKRR